MKPLSRRIMLPVLLFCTIAENASPESAKPFLNSAILIGSVRAKTLEKKSAKICACQLLDVKSTNETFKNLALFAEKTNDGSFATQKQKTLEVLQKERKNLKAFYSTISVKRQIVVSMDCSSLYNQLKGAYENLKVLETLNADIRLSLRK